MLQTLCRLLGAIAATMLALPSPLIIDGWTHQIDTPMVKFILALCLFYLGLDEAKNKNLPVAGVLLVIAAVFQPIYTKHKLNIITKSWTILELFLAVALVVWAVTQFLKSPKGPATDPPKQAT